MIDGLMAPFGARTYLVGQVLAALIAKYDWVDEESLNFPDIQKDLADRAVQIVDAVLDRMGTSQDNHR